ncbi:unnamed protein product, partial [Timema podura]|nr:unnamed protein product [Timema podura]
MQSVPRYPCVPRANSGNTASEQLRNNNIMFDIDPAVWSSDLSSIAEGKGEVITRRVASKLKSRQR